MATFFMPPKKDCTESPVSRLKIVRAEPPPNVSTRKRYVRPSDDAKRLSSTQGTPIPWTVDAMTILSLKMTMTFGSFAPDGAEHRLVRAAATCCGSSGIDLPYSNTRPAASSGSDSTNDKMNVDGW